MLHHHGAKTAVLCRRVNIHAPDDEVRVQRIWFFRRHFGYRGGGAKWSGYVVAAGCGGIACALCNQKIYIRLRDVVFKALFRMPDADQIIDAVLAEGWCVSLVPGKAQKIFYLLNVVFSGRANDHS